MAYASQSDLAARLAPEVLQELADDDGDTLPDTAVLEAALADAAGEIDQALSGRYVVPVDPAPAIMTRWCADLAAAALYLRRNQPLPRHLDEAAALTRRALEAIADGLASLAGATPRRRDWSADNTRLGEDAIFSAELLDDY